MSLRKNAIPAISRAMFTVSLLCVGQASWADNKIPARYVVGNDQQQERYDESKHGVIQADALHFNPGWYVGIGAGASMLDPENQSGGFSTNDDSDTGVKLTIGQQLLPHWGWEYGYLDAGEAGVGNVNPAIPDESVSYRIHSLFAHYSLFDPNTDFNVLGKLGVSTIRNSTSSNAITVDRQSSAQLAIGLAAQWRITDHWFLRLEHDRYDDDANYTGLTLGVFFGGENELDPAPEPVEEAKVVEPTPPPEPAVVVVPPPPPPEPPVEVCNQFNGVIEGLYFAIDSAELDQNARAILDRSVATLREFPNVSIVVEAHTDSTGTETYNKVLSILRAQAVVDFIIFEGIDQSRIDAKGFGETAPVASNATAAGRAKNRRVEFKTSDSTVCN